MFTPRNTPDSIRTPFFNVVPIAAFTGALDVFVALFLACAVLIVAAVLLRTRVSPRQQFILDLLEAESSTGHNADALPLHKPHPVMRRAA